MPLLVSSFIWISARGGAYHVRGSFGSFSSNSQSSAVRRSMCSRGTACLMTTYPLFFQKRQSSSESTRSVEASAWSRSLTALDVAVVGLPGMSACALSGSVAAGAIVWDVMGCLGGEEWSDAHESGASTAVRASTRVASSCTILPAVPQDTADAEHPRACAARPEQLVPAADAAP